MTQLQTLLPLLREATVNIGFTLAGLGSLVGLIAVASPKRFGELCDLSSRWVKTPLQVSAVDKQVADPERLARRHVRLTGMLIVVLATTLAIVVGRQ